MTEPKEPQLTATFHLHDSEITQMWVPDSGKGCEGFVSMGLQNLSVLIFNEEQADRLMIAALTAREALAKHRRERSNDPG